MREILRFGYVGFFEMEIDKDGVLGRPRPDDAGGEDGKSSCCVLRVLKCVPKVAIFSLRESHCII